MKNTKAIGLFVAVSLPSLLLVLVSFDAALVVGTDVFLLSLLQLLAIGVLVGYFYRKTSE